MGYSGNDMYLQTLLLVDYFWMALKAEQAGTSAI